MRHFGLAEDSGQGIDVIEDQMRLELLEEPIFSEQTKSFTVELPLGGIMSTTERGWLLGFEQVGVIRTEDHSLLLVASREGRLTNSRARELLGVDSTNARVRLGKLRDAGVLFQHGSRGRAYYTLGEIGPAKSNEQTVLDMTLSQAVTNQIVRDLTGLDRVAARALLRRLVDERRLLQRGSRRGTNYVRPT